MKVKKLLLVGATIVALTVVTTALVLAFGVSGSGTNPTAITNCTPAITVAVGTAPNPLVPGGTVSVPVTVYDNDDCVGTGVTITSVTPTVTGIPGVCGAGQYTVGAVTLVNITTSGGSALMQVPITLSDTAPVGCIGATAGLTVAVAGTVP